MVGRWGPNQSVGHTLAAVKEYYLKKITHTSSVQKVLRMESTHYTPHTVHVASSPGSSQYFNVAR